MISATANSRGRAQRLLLVSVLGFSSGLPLALSDSTLQAWLTVAGFDIATIGWFSLVSLPYVLKFLWAPLLDRYCWRSLGLRRGWMFGSQLAVVAIIFLISRWGPNSGLAMIAWLALALAIVSATQDVAVDAYRAQILRYDERGIGAGLSVAGYKIALIVSGAGAFIFADRYGFNNTYGIIGIIAICGLVATLLAREPKTTSAPGRLRDAFSAPLRQLLGRPQIVALIALICFYKLGDAAAGRLSTVFFVRELEFSLTELGAYYKGFGMASSLVGGVIGGALMMRWGLYRSLLVFAILQTLTNGGLLLLAIIGKSAVAMITVIIAENFCGGMGTAALVALMIALCDPHYTATQFALFTALASLGRVILGPPAGLFADTFGWVNFFGATILLALPGVMILILLRTTIERLDNDFDVSAAA